MNHAYRLVFNIRHNAWIAAPETAKSRGKGGRLKTAAAVLAATLALAPAVPAWALDANALPSGGQVVAGQGVVGAPAGNSLTINQSSQNLAIDWQSFNIGAAAAVNFVQPNSSAIALNRVIGGGKSEVFGKLNANGQVFLLNPNGVLFGQSAEVNVGGLVASTLGLSNADFMARNFRFTAASTVAGEVSNQGTLNGNYVALLGGQVSNSGAITARLGTVALAAGSDITLDFAGDGLIGVQVNQGALDALADNKGLIRADGGLVLMTAQAADHLIGAVVNNDGVIEARTVENKSGRILLLGDMASGTVQQNGTLDASAPDSGDGGFIETSAAKVGVGETARVTTFAANGRTGLWLIDPNDYTIAAAGGNITGAALSSALGGSNVQISTATQGTTGGNGDIFVNDSVSWSANKLTLTAERDIRINALLDGSGTAQLALEYGQGALAAGNTANYYVNLNTGAKVNLPAGQNFSTKLGSNGATTDFTVITSLGAAGSTTATDLQGISGTLGGRYVLGGDIDASDTSTWNSGEGFLPIGSTGDFTGGFTGTFDGLGHTIYKLSGSGGLFGRIGDGGTVKNLILDGNPLDEPGGTSTISGGQGEGIGVLAGQNAGSIDNVRVQKYNVHSNQLYTAVTGGLVGWNLASGRITNSSVTHIYLGGAVGSSGFRVAPHITGGLVGYNFGSIATSLANTIYIGPGGTLEPGVAIDSNFGYWYPYPAIGGLVAVNEGTITDSSVTGNSVLQNSYPKASLYEGSYYESYAIGALVGDNGGTITNSHSSGVRTTYFYPSSGDIIYPALLGPTTNYPAVNSYNSYSSLPKSASAYSGWDFDNVWRIYEGYSVPLLRAHLTPLTVTADNVGKTYDGLAYTAALSNPVYSITGAAANLLNTGDPYGSPVNAGSYAPQLAPVASSALFYGYEITYVGSTLTVGKAPLSVTANDASFGYDGTSWSGGNGVVYSGWVNGEGTGVLGGSLSYGGTAQGAVNANSYSITPSGQSGSNYNITYVDGTLTITPAPLTITASNASKTYGDTLSFAGSEFGSSGLQNGETIGGVSLASAGAAATAGVAGGPYAITIGGASGGTFNAGNYSITYANGTLTVTARPIGVTAANQSRAYGSANPSSGAVSVSSGTLVNGDTLGTASLSTTATATTAANQTAPLTPSAQSFTAGTAGNYAITYVNGTLTITPAPLTITANNASKTYGDTLTSLDLGFSSSGLQNGELIDVTLASAGTPATASVAGGPYAITASNATDAGVFGPPAFNAGNYSITYNNGALTISPAPLAVTANDAGKTYDGLAWSGGNGVAYSGFVNSENAGALGGSLSYGGSAQGAVNANSYSITPQGLTSGNYAISFNNGALTISPAQLTVNMTAADKTYDGTLAATPTFTVTGGLVGSETVGFTGTASFASKDVANGIVVTDNGDSGTVDGTNGGLAGNYIILPINSTTANITPAPLTVTASNALKIYDNRPWSGGNGMSYAGLAVGETGAVLGGAPVYGGSAQGATGAGSYVISLSGLTSGNYTITFRDGVLTISPVRRDDTSGMVLASVSLPPAESRSGSTRTASLIDVMGAGMRLPEGVEQQ